jgi:hypothetical protein
MLTAAIPPCPAAKIPGPRFCLLGPHCISLAVSVGGRKNTELTFYYELCLLYLWVDSVVLGSSKVKLTTLSEEGLNSLWNVPRMDYYLPV